MLGGGGETAQDYASRSRPPEGWGALSISAPFCYTLTLHTDKAAALIPRVALEEPFSEALLPGSTQPVEKLLHGRFWLLLRRREYRFWGLLSLVAAHR